MFQNNYKQIRSKLGSCWFPLTCVSLACEMTFETKLCTCIGKLVGIDLRDVTPGGTKKLYTE